MSGIDNPAARLLALFQAARKIDQGAAATKGWSEIFGIKQTDTVQFMKHATQMFELASETRRLVEAYQEEAPKILLKHFPEVEKTLQKFQIVLTVKMGQFLADLDPKSGEHALELCSWLLHKRSPEPVVDEDTAIWLSQELNELIEEVITADDLEPNTKKWIIKRFNDVLDTLTNLRIYGTPDLEAAKDRLFGGLIGKSERIAGVRNTKLKNRILSFVVALDLVINFGANLRQLTANQPSNPSPIVIEIQKQVGIEGELPALPPASASQEEPK